MQRDEAEIDFRRASKLRKSVPFITASIVSRGSTALLLDRVEVPLELARTDQLLARLEQSLSLSGDAMISAGAAERIVQDQIDVGLEAAYSDDYLQMLRDGSTELTAAYVLEKMHYVDASTFRLAAGIGRDLGRPSLLEIVTRHALEEVGHETYYADALVHMGCSRATLNALFPMPVTTELIYAMRALSRLDPLVAALCSGFIERSTEQPGTQDWHEVMVGRGAITKAAVDSIRAHAHEDIASGHSEIWNAALRAERYIAPGRLAQALNAISLLAEMLSRWFGSLRSGLALDLAKVAPLLNAPAARPRFPVGSSFPVLSAEVLHQATHSELRTSGGRQSVAIAVGFRGLDPMTQPAGRTRSLAEQALRMLPRTSSSDSNDQGKRDIVAEVRSWLRVVEGHRLWVEMLDKPSYATVCGWKLERFHYASSAAQHIGSALSVCPDREIRDSLARHLTTALDRVELLRQDLCETKYGDVTQYRPLPTTVALVGALCDLAREDWKAYCLAFSFLKLVAREPVAVNQTTLLRRLLQACPECEGLLRNEIDDGLRDTAILPVERLATYQHEIDAECLRRAAIVPQLTWSYLDGIRCFYTHGDTAMRSRMGWRVAYT